MELYIRSQDKYTLVKFNNDIKIINGTGLKEALKESLLASLANMEQMKELKDGWCVNIDDLTLGTYATKERALEVLDEIENILKPQEYEIPTTRNTFISSTKISNYVYEMPKE